MQQVDVEQAYKDVHTFNAIASNFDDVGEASVDHQLSMIFSELEEAIEAFENRDAPELLKEAVDVWVTATGLLQKLSAAGFDVGKALKEVNENNLSKYIPKGKSLQYDENFTASFNQEFQVWMIKDKDNKIRKPSCYVKADVSHCVPNDEFFKEATV